MSPAPKKNKPVQEPAGIVRKCSTETHFYPPQKRNPYEIVVDATEGFIPLWRKRTVLYWRFSPSFKSYMSAGFDVKARVKELMEKAILAWGDACPVRFKERSYKADFEIVMAPDDCDHTGCTLAMAFFPCDTQEKIVVYPKLFSCSKAEQVETMAHELGHVFGLRHYFAKSMEASWPSEIFGTHDRFSIMNYGSASVLTAADRRDLKLLYEKVWSGEMNALNNVSFKLIKPYHLKK